jgi:hypothetical protein
MRCPTLSDYVGTTAVLAELAKTRNHPGGFIIMGKSTVQRANDDLWSWVVIAAIFGGVNLALWGTLLW